MLRKLLLAASLLCLIAGLTFTASVMYISYMHNPQGEFHLNGKIDWSHWISLGALAGSIPYLLCATLFIIYRKIK